MQPILYHCLTHNRLNDIYCTACNTYICPECITTHRTPNHKPRYVHVLQYAQDCTYKKMDDILNSIKGSRIDTEDSIKKFVEELIEISPQIAHDININLEKLKQLRNIISSIGNYLVQGKTTASADKIVSELNNDKEEVNLLVKNEKIEELISFLQKIDEQQNIEKQHEKSKDLIQKLKDVLVELGNVDVHKNVISSAKSVATECNMYRLIQYVKNWKCDKKYLSFKMTLSDNGLIFGNSATNGYPAIIGDVPFDSGLYAFDVIPKGLDCTGKEGFGIIESEKYMEAVKSNKETPTVHENIIGFMYKKDAKKMKADIISDMKMGEKYRVKVNIPELYITITGPEVSLRAELKKGVVYYPCFSCGCSSNKIEIIPLEYFDE